MTEVFYAAVKGSLHANDSSVFGLKPEEYSALCRRFPDSNKEIINGVLIKGSPIDVINSLAELGYRVTCSSGEAEIVWTLRREALPGERITSPLGAPSANVVVYPGGKPFVVQPSMPKPPLKQAEKIGTKPEDWQLLGEIREQDRIQTRHISSIERIEPGEKIILKTNLSSEFNPLSKNLGSRATPRIAIPVTRQKLTQDEIPAPPPETIRPLQGTISDQPRAMSSHQHHNANPSVAQTLDEMDFERGLWYPAMQGDLAGVDKVLAKGFDVNKMDKSGYTALHYAARGGDLGVVRKLLTAGASTNVKTKAGLATPLHRAASAGHLEVVKLLLETGAEKTPVDSDGRTPLHRSAASGHENVSLLLLKAAPDAAKIRDSKGLLPGDVAKGMGHVSLSRIIQDNAPGSNSTRSISPGGNLTSPATSSKNISRSRSKSP